MSRLISDLLSAEEPLFSISLRQLEENSGKPAVDVRLTAEIIGKVRLKTKELGLDPDDTTGKELYTALVNKIEEHNKHLRTAIGGTDKDTVTDLIPKMKAAADKVDIPRDCWVLRKSVAKRFLRESPPKQMMKLLGYKSIDSMLKNENILELLGALRFSEGASWLNAYNEKYKTLKPTDFETRKIEIIIMPQRWADMCEEYVHKKKHNITHSKEMGVVIMLPVKKDHIDGITIWATSLLFHYINEVRLYSSFFKMQQVKPDFGKILVNTLIADPSDAAVMAGNKVHWRVIQRYFGKLENEVHPEVFQPHVQPEDLHWRHAEGILYEIAPELKFWEDLDFVGVMHGKRPVVFNMMDVAASYANKTPYSKREIYHFREALWNELFMRYMGESMLEKQILKQLDNDMIAPEDLDGE